MQPDERRGGRVMRALVAASFVAGAAGLLLAMTVDASAVLGRHLGVPVLGSIELVQACVVLMGSSALVGTTLSDRHASVHLLTEHLSPTPRRALLRLAHLLSALFFALLAVGSSIVMRDLWHGDERSDLLALPYAPLRAFFVVSLLLGVVLFVRAALARRTRPGDA
jgi:TRAP-type C4-dicarboxylate transport system permease small subunit